VDKISAALAADVRTAAEVERDPEHRPIETLEFFGLRDDMKIVELLPGGGWYTKILAPVMAGNGTLYIAYRTSRVKEALSGEPGFERMQIPAEGAKIHRPEGSYFYVLENAELGVTGADMVLTFRNYHNFNAEGRAAMNQAVYNALKPGGIYAVVDHTRRHMEADNLHFRPDDELCYEVGRKTVTGNTDRFTLKFVKK
jgi:predicted methyltransferase